MRIKEVSLKCPKCNKSPKIKQSKLGTLTMFQLSCRCHKGTAWIRFSDAISSWLYYLESTGRFNGYYNLKIED